MSMTVEKNENDIYVYKHNEIHDPQYWANQKPMLMLWEAGAFGH